MTRRAVLFRLVAFALLLGLGLGLGGEARADIGDEIAAELRAEGYTDVTIERTLLGRIRVVGRAPGKRREVVIDRGTGEILRDLTEEEDSSVPVRPPSGAHA